MLPADDDPEEGGAKASRLRPKGTSGDVQGHANSSETRPRRPGDQRPAGGDAVWEGEWGTTQPG